MNRSIYLKELKILQRKMMQTKNTPFSVFAKVVSLATMNMRYEKVAFNRDLKVHPYLLTRDIVKDALGQFDQIMEVAFIESDDKSLNNFQDRLLEKKHKDLWQEIWSRHSEKEFQEFVDLKKHRMKINGLLPYVRGKDCVDFGCGNGSFAIALIELGAKSVTGIDFGEQSVAYAKKVAKARGLEKKTRFYVADLLKPGLPKGVYDFAVSNGVFHHLKKEKMTLAIKQVRNALRPKGYFWYYIDGKDAISMDLFDCSVAILEGVGLRLQEDILKRMNIRRNKMVHLMDGMNARYIHSSFEETAGMLRKNGFGNFRRLTGGAPTDFDADVVSVDKYGKEKFGCGDLRILSQLV